VVKRIAKGPWRRATFFTSLADDGAPRGAWSMQAWLGDVAGRALDLVAEIASADLAVMVAAAGTSPPAASVIGEACALNRVMTTALIVDARGQLDAALSRTLAALAPPPQCWSSPTARTTSRRCWRRCGRKTGRIANSE